MYVCIIGIIVPIKSDRVRAIDRQQLLADNNASQQLLVAQLIA